jgi:hypothetical protein
MRAFAFQACFTLVFPLDVAVSQRQGRARRPEFPKLKTKQQFLEKKSRSILKKDRKLATKKKKGSMEEVVNQLWLSLV